MIYAEIPWHKRTVKIPGIYAPNNPGENEAFWEELSAKLDSSELPQFYVMMGDFNVVDDSIDRTPVNNDSQGAKRVLVELKSKSLLQEEW